jgi:hypothetical protein
MLANTLWIMPEEMKPPEWPRRRKAAALLLVLGIAAFAYFLWVRTESAASHSLARVGQPLPPLPVEVSNTEVDLNNYAAGNRRVIVFYSPSCSTCRRVLPALRPLPAGIRLILVNEAADRNDFRKSDFAGAAFFHDRRRVLAHSFGAAAMPVVLFVDEGGILRDALAGSHEKELIQRKLKEFAVHSGNPAEP